MNPDDHDQNCPFCNASWGSCDHYRILAEWEAKAAVQEPPVRQTRRRPHDESSPSTTRRDGPHPES